MSKIHERVLDRLQSQLGEPFKVVDVKHYDKDSSLLVIEGPVGQQEGLMPKASIQDRINGLVVIPVDPGTTYEQLFKKFSDLNDLFWVAGVDYPTNTSVVEFGEGSASSQFTYSVPDTSYLWKGFVEIEATQIQPGADAPLVINIDPVRIGLALSSMIFQLEDDMFTEGNKAISAKFAKVIIAHLKSKGLGGITPADIGNGEIVDLVVDGFSGIAVVRPKRGPVLFIRFRSKSPKPRTK